MVTSNNPIDAISIANGLSPNGATELMESPEFREWLTDYLSESNITLTFKKKDGTLRTMYCTKNLNNIPAEKHPKGSNKLVSDNTITVFDLQLNEWRSFVVSNLVRLDYERSSASSV